jgi:fructokinase
MTLRIGVDLGGTKIEAIALDGSRELMRVRVETPRGDYRGTIEAVAALIAGIERRIGAPGTVGVGIPGALSPETGLVKNANSTWLIGRPLGADLEERLKRAIRVANDANCFAISEARDGAAEGAAVVFGVIAGTGTGGGIVVDGRVLTGANAIAGEWGHNPLPWPQPDEWPGPACYCGRSGCIETFLSGPAIAREYAALTGVREMPSTIVALAEGGEPHAGAILARYEDRMARALAGVVNVLDPDVIVLGGGMSNIGRLYDSVPRLIAAYVFGATGGHSSAVQLRVTGGSGGAGRGEPAAPASVHVRMVRARHGDSSGVRGAAWLWPL